MHTKSFDTKHSLHHFARETMVPLLLFSIFAVANIEGKSEDERSLAALLLLPVYNTNATSVYNSETEKCCKGKLIPLNSNEKCCGDKTYEPATQLCCNGEVQPLQSNYSCCDKTTYDTTTQFCCKESYIISSSDPPTRYTQCCGNTTYNFEKQKCCAHSGQFTVFDITSPDSGCCGDKLFNRETELCCRDYERGTANLYSMENNFMICCNGKAIDTQVQGCCNEVPYNLDDSTCCRRIGTSAVIPVTEKGQLCCGEQQEAYNPNSHICCGNKVFENPDFKLFCCGNDAYHVENDLCCNSKNGSKAVKKNSPEQNVCCGYTPHDFATQSCCSDGNEKFQLYFETESICCKGNLYTTEDMNGNEVDQKIREDENFECCGANLFNNAKELCCNDIINPISEDDNQDCCGNITYNTNTETCCQRFDINTGNINYAVINEIDPAKTCCGSELISSNDGKECCSSKVFNPNDEICCGSQIISKREDKSIDSCCYPYSTDEFPWNSPMKKRK